MVRAPGVVPITPNLNASGFRWQLRRAAEPARETAEVCARRRGEADRNQEMGPARNEKNPSGALPSARRAGSRQSEQIHQTASVSGGFINDSFVLPGT